jgi:hypothetical protein
LVFHKKRHLIYLVLSVLAGLAILCFLITNSSLKVQYALAGNVSTDSFLYQYAMERIIRIYSEEPEKVTNLILKEYNLNDPYFYVDTVLLSIFADPPSTNALRTKIDNLTDFQDKIYSDSGYSLLIESIGIAMMKDREPFLVDLLSKLNNSTRIASAINYTVARSLFFLTGKTYKYTNRKNSKSTVRLTDHILKTRDVLVNSMDRKRTVDEMILLLDAI